MMFGTTKGNNITDPPLPHPYPTKNINLDMKSLCFKTQRYWTTGMQVTKRKPQFDDRRTTGQKNGRTDRLKTTFARGTCITT